VELRAEGAAELARQAEGGIATVHVGPNPHWMEQMKEAAKATGATTGPTPSQPTHQYYTLPGIPSADAHGGGQVAQQRVPGGPPLPVPPETLADRIKAARLGAAALNDATDRLNGVFVEAEKALVGLKLGVQAYVEMVDDEGHEDITPTLAFRKHEGNWTLVVDVPFPDGSDRWSTCHLLKASRELRLQAADLLPQLVEQLIEKTASKVDEVNERVKAVEGLVSELKRAKS
jgi:hypothetical protein